MQDDLGNKMTQPITQVFIVQAKGSVILGVFRYIGDAKVYQSSLAFETTLATHPIQLISQERQMTQEQITSMLNQIFTPEEIEAIKECLNQGILDGWAEKGNDDPIVTALMKVAPDSPPQFDEE